MLAQTTPPQALSRLSSPIFLAWRVVEFHLFVSESALVAAFVSSGGVHITRQYLLQFQAGAGQLCFDQGEFLGMKFF